MSLRTADKTLFISMRCFSRMIIFNVHISIIIMNSLDTRFSRNVFEAVQKPRSTCFIGSKTTRLRLVVLNPIKHSCSFYKHYLKFPDIVKLHTCLFLYDHIYDNKSSKFSLPFISEQHNYGTRNASTEIVLLSILRFDLV